MNRNILIVLFLLICANANAGDFVFHTNGVITGKRDSCGKICSQRPDALRVDKTTYESTTKKFHRVVDGKIIEKTQLEKDTILQAEADTQKQAKENAINNLQVSVEELINALVAEGIITKQELIDQIKVDNGLAP